MPAREDSGECPHFANEDWWGAVVAVRDVVPGNAVGDVPEVPAAADLMASTSGIDLTFHRTMRMPASPSALFFVESALIRLFLVCVLSSSSIVKTTVESFEQTRKSTLFRLFQLFH